MYAVGRLLTRIGFILTLIVCIMCTAQLTAKEGRASAGPAFSRTLVTGPYIVQVNLYQYPPVTDQAVQVTVVPQKSTLHLTGHITMLPGLGTDAVPLHAQLSSLNSNSTLIGSIRMPVRGAWNIEIQLQGSQGTGEASFPIVVAGPGAIPIWLGWLIGSLPLLCLAWIIWHQQRYRRQLLAQNTV